MDSWRGWLQSNPRMSFESRYLFDYLIRFGEYRRRDLDVE